jgi:acetoin utilization deacetylase AcuC-like enzyme
MARTAVVIDPDFLKHEPGELHPESPDRLRILLDVAKGFHEERVRVIRPRAATTEEIKSCHTSHHIELIRATSETEHYALDGDTITSADSFGVALLAVGGFIELLDSVANADFHNGFALVRPPGHHAMRDHAMGFCLFNTAAIGAHHLKRLYGAKRILIVDWDVHHGNGTQDAFYHDPSVLYISTHQYPYYPGTGALEEVGDGKGEGFTVNIPLPAGCGDDEYLRVFQEIVMPIADRYEPEWVLVSAGFDPHARDPLGGMAVTEKGFGAMASLLLDVAQKHAAGKIAFLLEGGYDLMALRDSVAVVLQVMERETREQLPKLTGGSRLEPLVRKALRVQERYW